MIPSIGVMIGTYIITRMVDMMFRPKHRSTGTAAIVFAAITILVSVVVIADVITASSDMASQFRGLGR